MTSHTQSLTQSLSHHEGLVCVSCSQINSKRLKQSDFHYLLYTQRHPRLDTSSPHLIQRSPSSGQVSASVRSGRGQLQGLLQLHALTSLLLGWAHYDSPLPPPERRIPGHALQLRADTPAPGGSQRPPSHRPAPASAWGSPGGPGLPQVDAPTLGGIWGMG